MSARRILTIGLELASSDTQYASFQSKMSLLDWDIILFKPQILEFSGYGDFYQGKRSLSDSLSFQLKECCEHWRREIKQAVETGKTVIIYLPSLDEVFVDTGQRSYSGTGRNQRTTRHVAEYNNYQAIPAELSPVTATGSSMKLSAKGSEVLAPYWAEFESSSKYSVILTSPKVPACVVTRTGGKAVGAIYRSKASAGSMLLLPDIEFYAESFFKTKGDKQTWTPAAIQFAGRMVSTLVSLDKALRVTGEVTPEPAWASVPLFSLSTDTKAVNIDKLRQLSMNIHEDLQRESVTAPAKPVLFGNGFRLQPLNERADPFTDKCHSAAATSSTALIFTPDLFARQCSI